MNKEQIEIKINKSKSIIKKSIIMIIVTILFLVITHIISTIADEQLADCLASHSTSCGLGTLCTNCPFQPINIVAFILSLISIFVSPAFIVYSVYSLIYNNITINKLYKQLNK